jgi:2-keto-4-pentenoate hydratase/2-oxohepta-3-ene-1,7-dioic acid hydratase in catechol pathway
MRLVRYGKPGREKPGLIDAHDTLRDLSAVVPDIGPQQLSAKGLARLARLNTARLPAVRGRPRFGPPLTGSSKFVGIGLNYADHAAESGAPVPREPIVFHKTLSSIVGPDDDLMLPRGSTKTDWEVELGIVIGTRARHVAKKDALTHVAGYLLVNDVSEREYQLERSGLWDKGKGCDTFGPIGPWIVTTDELLDPQRLDMWLDVNGEKRQRGNTRTMIFDCATLVAYVSRFMTLNPGDLIATGTPPGVGMGMKPPRYLRPGDVISAGIDGLGTQTRRVVRFRP